MHDTELPEQVYALKVVAHHWARRVATTNVIFGVVGAFGALLTPGGPTLIGVGLVAGFVVLAIAGAEARLLVHGGRDGLRATHIIAAAIGLGSALVMAGTAMFNSAARPFDECLASAVIVSVFPILPIAVPNLLLLAAFWRVMDRPLDLDTPPPLL